MDALMEERAQARRILLDETLSPKQVTFALAGLGRDLAPLSGPAVEDFEKLAAAGLLCDLFEGRATYVPRYIVPDYSILMEQGSAFLRLPPPADLYEATAALLAAYHQVPSVTHFPVFIGRLDALLEPFVLQELEAAGRESAYRLLRGFLRLVDRTITDSFTHANLGPAASLTGQLILEAELELQNATPNISLLYDPDLTEEAFALQCARTALDCAKPSFANHAMFQKELGEDYALASCYNGLPIGGGAYTLSRILLGAVAAKAGHRRTFFEEDLPRALDVLLAYMDEKIRFLVEEAPFFRSSFLVREGWIRQDRFTGLLGVVGLAEAVDLLLAAEGSQARFGDRGEADALGLEIMDCIAKRVGNHINEHCAFWEGRFMLHAQVGIAEDEGISPGARLPIGRELPLYDHLRHCALFHPYFPSGAGDIFPFDSTARRNPGAVLDIFKGALAGGARYLSTYTADSDVIRITGYLVKRSELAALKAGQQVLGDTTALGLGAVQRGRVEERKVRELHEG